MVLTVSVRSIFYCERIKMLREEVGEEKEKEKEKAKKGTCWKKLK